MQLSQQKYSFRQFLIPLEHEQVKNYRPKTLIVNHKILQAIGDSSQPPLVFSLNQAIINGYKKLGLVIRPDNIYLLAWQVVIVCIILFYILEIGMLIAFAEAFWFDQLNHFLASHIIFILIFSADILLSPLKSYYDEGILITDISAIYQKYLHLELWIDLIGLISIIVPIATGLLQSNWIKVLLLLKIYTMKKINIELQRATQLNITINTIYLVLKLIIFCYIYGHFMGIGFYIVSKWVYTNNYYGPNTPNLCWVYNAWAFYQLQIILNWQQIYTYIMYYSIAVVTTIAYGDITPKNPIQCVYTIFALIAVTLIFGYLMTEILRLLLNIFAYNFSRKFVHDELILKFKNEYIQQSVQIQFRSHSNQIDRQQQYRNRSIQQKIMNFLPSEPLYGLQALIYSSFLKDVGFDFINISGEYKHINQSKSLFLEHFMKEIKEERHYIGDVLYHRGQSIISNTNGHSVYYFTKEIHANMVTLGVGQLPTLKGGVIDKTNNRKKTFQIKKCKKMFGEQQFFNGQQRTHWAFCGGNCVMFVANRNSLIHHYNLLTQDEKQIVFRRIQNFQSLSCLFCEGMHSFSKCDYVFFNSRQTKSADKHVGRTKSNISQYTTHLKRQSSWSLYKKIRTIHVMITKEYKDRLLSNKLNHSLFIEYELNQDNKIDDEENFDTELYQTEVMVERIENQYLIQRGLKSSNIEYDSVYHYKNYKPYNNIDAIIKRMEKKKRNKK